MFQTLEKPTHFLFCFVLFLCLGISSKAQTAGFASGYEIAGWSKTVILDGTTEIISNSVSEAQFKYTVRKSGGGVSNRTADYIVTVPDDATITFDWVFSGNHRWFNAYEEFHLVVNGEEVATPLARFKSVGVFNHSGFNQTVSVVAGDTFGFRIGGENFDSASNLDGLLTISNFRVEQTATPNLDLVISKNSSTPGTYDFSWASRSGRVYDILSSTDLSIPTENWPVWNGLSNLPGSSNFTLIQGAISQETKRFFLVVEKSAP